MPTCPSIRPTATSRRATPRPDLGYAPSSWPHARARRGPFSARHGDDMRCLKESLANAAPPASNIDAFIRVLKDQRTTPSEEQLSAAADQEERDKLRARLPPAAEEKGLSQRPHGGRMQELRRKIQRRRHGHRG